MRKHALATLTIAFTALLLTQSLGLHLHVQGMDQPGGAHVVHIQHDDHDHGHDHQNEVDGSKLELGNVWSKILPLILLSLLLAIPCAPRTAVRLFGARPSRPDRPPLRWRPPLRAPPILT